MKYQVTDRYDSLVFRNDRFIHKDILSSPSIDNFSIECGRCTKSGRFGVSKKEWKASGRGIRMSAFDVGDGK